MSLTGSSHTNFKFINGLQSIDITTAPIDEAPLITADFVMGPPADPLRGSKLASPECSPLYLPSSAQGPTECTFNQTLLRTLSYQAVMQAFNDLFTGTIYTITGNTAPNVESGIVDTVFAETPELRFLTQSQLDISNLAIPPNLQDAVLVSNATLFNSIYNNESLTMDKPLTEAMETMFERIAVSLMTSTKLRYVSIFRALILPA